MLFFYIFGPLSLLCCFSLFSFFIFLFFVHLLVTPQRGMRILVTQSCQPQINRFSLVVIRLNVIGEDSLLIFIQ